MEAKIDKELSSISHKKIVEQRSQIKIEKLLVKYDEDMLEYWSASRMFEFMRNASVSKFDNELICDENNAHYIKAICFFLSFDPRFQTELNYSFKKGILIRGDYGVGKTHIIKCVADNYLQRIALLSMLKISEQIKTDGEYNINYNNREKIYLDDVGTEETTVNHYGTKINFFKDFIEKTYDMPNMHNRLIITTNCSFDELEEKYGGRVRSRMAEMFNVIDVTGEDYRKK